MWWRQIVALVGFGLVGGGVAIAEVEVLGCNLSTVAIFVLSAISGGMVGIIGGVVMAKTGFLDKGYR